jgi:hypothetical protein
MDVRGWWVVVVVVGGEVGETAAKSSSSEIRFLIKPMQHAVNVQKISEQNLHEV